MEILNIEAGNGGQPERGLQGIEKMSEEEVVELVLQNVPENKRNDLRELINQNSAKGDRELPVFLLKWHHLLIKKAELYKKQGKASESEKQGLNDELLKVWADINQVAKKIDQKIATTLMQEISATLRFSEKK